MINILLGNAEYEGKDLTIFGNEQGLPEVTGIIPCPFESEEERAITFDKHLKAITIRGYLIIETKRLRNIAFDKKGEKTSLRVKYRACKNEEEIHAIAKEIYAIRKSFEITDLSNYHVAVEKMKFAINRIGGISEKV